MSFYGLFLIEHTGKLWMARESQHVGTGIVSSLPERIMHVVFGMGIAFAVMLTDLSDDIGIT